MHTAASCRVSSDATVLCATVPGTGRGHRWRALNVGGQDSEWTAKTLTTSYAPPVITGYAGEASGDARTAGSQTLVVLGANFGPAGPAVLDFVRSIDATGRVVPSTGCNVSVAHTEVFCAQTGEGAVGSLVRYEVSVGGQVSTTPATNVGAPKISALGGPGANAARTVGGQRLIISGHDFGLPGALDGVQFGSPGHEQSVLGCVIPDGAHERIECTTPAGVGAGLRWAVLVGGQMSEPSTAAMMSYAHVA